MTQFRAPVSEAQFVLNDVLGFEKYRGLLNAEELDATAIGEILAQGGVLAERVLHPINASGDAHGCTVEDGGVRTPPGFAEAFQTYVDGGWPALTGDPQYGGDGAPLVLAVALDEFFWAANASFSMYLSPGRGIASVLMSHGTKEQRSRYAPHLISGRWTGAMGLTEPQAGSDVGLARTRAVAVGDGSYRIAGEKIFNSGGDHDLAENVVQLVLARMQGAPAGTRGLSLFLVPKFLLDEDGSLGERNTMQAVAVEHKMGLRGSATCVMSFDDATGYLVGEPGRGLQAMFILMNEARLTSAAGALGLSEVAYQSAAAYVRERRQGRAPDGPQEPSEAADLLVAQPDVRRILLEIRTFNEAARVLNLWTALQADISRTATEAAEREAANARLALMTPVLKGAFPELALANSVAAQQLFGGHGYICETGVEQFVRDVRVLSIGEGVTAVQAWDLVHRKLGLGGGQVVEDLLAEMMADASSVEREGEPWRTQPLAAAIATLRKAIADLAEHGPTAAAATSVHFLHLLAQVSLGWAWVKLLRAAEQTDANSPAAQDRRICAQFFLERLPAQAAWRGALITLGDRNVLDLPAERF